MVKMSVDKNTNFQLKTNTSVINNIPLHSPPPHESMFSVRILITSLLNK